jgi:hypothetical protein
MCSSSPLGDGLANRLPAVTLVVTDSAGECVVPDCLATLDHRLEPSCVGRANKGLEAY